MESMLAAMSNTMPYVNSVALQMCLMLIILLNKWPASRIAKDLPAEIASKEPFHVDCSKRKEQFDYLKTVLPSLLEHRYISFTPAMSQRRDRYF